MCPKGHPTKNIGVPERDGMVVVYFVKKELFHSLVKAHEIRTKEQMSTEDYSPEDKSTEDTQQNSEGYINPAEPCTDSGIFSEDSLNFLTQFRF